MAYVTDRIRQLKVVKELFTYASAVNPYPLTLIYNSAYFSHNNFTPYQVPGEMGLNMRLGSGWTINAFQTVAAAVPFTPMICSWRQEAPPPTGTCWKTAALMPSATLGA